ncbi:MAG: hypothetical protein K8R40_04135 [Anaerolineaceae bacterium]|nr:hypothetical protein [Anaerolineaceae bacterium]
MKLSKFDLLTKAQNMDDGKTNTVPIRSGIKIILTFFLINVLFAIVSSDIGNISLHHHLFEGRHRFPFGEIPVEAYNLSLYNLEAMFRSHELHIMDDKEEYSIVVIGDSSVWGTLLDNEETLTGQLNKLNLISNEGLPVRFYNAGYPTISVTKDLLLLSKIRDSYEPDSIIWLVTLEAMPWEKQLNSPIVQNNPELLVSLNQEFNLDYDLSSDNLNYSSFWDRTIIGQRREIADIFRLQLYGFLWGATGIDQYYPETYNFAQRDLDADNKYHNFSETNFTSEYLAFEIISAGRSMFDQNIPFILVNEPIMISTGENSNIRYNFYYPRWAYDLYRGYFFEYTKQQNDIQFLDFWDIIPEDEFTNSAIHLTPYGESILANEIRNSLLQTGIVKE